MKINQLKVIIKECLLQQDILKQDKSYKLFEDTLKFIRKRFRVMSDEQVQEFMKRLAKFCNGQY